MDPEDKRLLEASASGQTDGVLQLLEEPNGHQLHKFKGQKISKGNSGVSSILPKINGKSLCHSRL